MEDYPFMMRNWILRLMSDADLTVENTLRDLMDRISLDDWSSVEELVDAGNNHGANFDERTTILEILAAIQRGGLSPR